MTLQEDYHKFKVEQTAKDAQQDEQIKSLYKSVNRLYHIVFCFCFIMLLALIWGALGPDGFNAVTKAYPATKPTGDIITYAIPTDNRHYIQIERKA